MLTILTVATFLAGAAHGRLMSSPRLTEDFAEAHSALTIDSVPWLVSIGHRRARNDSIFEYYHVCSGGLISDEWIITAAHCVDDSDDFFPVNTVLSGGTNYMTEGLRHSISRKVVHPQYRFVPGGKMPLNDVALIQLASPLAPGASRASLTAYHRSMETIQDEAATASCWGGKHFHERPHNLRSHETRIMLRAQCDRYLEKEATSAAQRAGKLCAYHENNAPSCEGDSGFPLVMENDLSVDVVGIQSSYPKSCSPVGRPIVFTAVADYYGWISSTTGLSRAHTAS